MSAKTHRKTDPYRRALIGKVHIAKAALGLDDDAYRDLLAARAGKRSAAKCSNAQLVGLLEYFKAQGFRAWREAGTRRPAPGPEAAKARALWISLYHLGVVRDPAEAALAAYAARQTGLAAPEWIRDWRPVVEGLKGWAARPAEKGGGGVDWSPYPTHGAPARRYNRARVIEAQWRILLRAGAVRHGGTLDGYCRAIAGIDAHVALVNFSDVQLDRVIETLGRKIRAAKATGKHETSVPRSERTEK